MMKRFLLALLFILGVSSAHAQEKVEQEENVEGIGNVLGYFGKKLSKELGARLNLEDGEEEEKEELVPTKVYVKIGPFTIEKTEFRPRKKTAVAAKTGGS